MKGNSQLKKLRSVETRINKNLFFICAGVTAVVMAMKLAEFFSRGAFAPTRIELFYLGVLVIYSLHKEIVRWLGERKVERQGEYFVYVWVGLTTLLYVVNFLSNNHFGFSEAGRPLTILRETSLLTVQVLAVFIVTRVLKLLRIILTRREIFNKISRNE
jgi:hypothetical protein